MICSELTTFAVESPTAWQEWNGVNERLCSYLTIYLLKHNSHLLKWHLFADCFGAPTICVERYYLGVAPKNKKVSKVVRP